MTIFSFYQIEIPLIIASEKPKTMLQDSTAFDKLYDSLKIKIDSLEQQQLRNDIESAKQHIERANRIIDWSAMFFAALTVLLIIAGAIGLREFSQIRKTERSMQIILSEVKKELVEIQKYRSDIIKETKEFTEITYYLNEGITAYESGNYLKSREFLHRVLDLDNNHLRAIYFIGKSLMMENKFEEAKENFNKILSIDSRSSIAYLGLAMSCSDSESDQAIKYCQQALEYDSQNASALDYMGLINRKLANLNESIDNHIQARRLRKAATTSYFLGLIYFVNGDEEKTRKYFDEAKYLAQLQIERVFKVHWAYYIIGVIEGLNQNLNEAQNFFRKSQDYNKSESIRRAIYNDLNFLLQSGKNKTEVESMVIYLS